MKKYEKIKDLEKIDNIQYEYSYKPSIIYKILFNIIFFISLFIEINIYFLSNKESRYSTVKIYNKNKIINKKYKSSTRMMINPIV
jgi:hypothetical protein